MYTISNIQATVFPNTFNEGVLCAASLGNIPLFLSPRSRKIQDFTYKLKDRAIVKSFSEYSQTCTNVGANVFSEGPTYDIV